MPIRPYGNPPAFELNEYNLGNPWSLFIQLSNIDVGVEPSARPKYKAAILKTCLSRSTLAAPQSSGLTEAQLDNPDAIISHLSTRANAGRNRYVWRQKLGNRVQRPNEATNDWLCGLRDIARKCEFHADCCTKY